MDILTFNLTGIRTFIKVKPKKSNGGTDIDKYDCTYHTKLHSINSKSVQKLDVKKLVKQLKQRIFEEKKTNTLRLDDSDESFLHEVPGIIF